MNPNKSSYLCFNIPKHETQGIELVMSGEKISCEECTVHLGITRDIKNKVHIEEKISLSRKTAYLLMGAGFHSVNGLKTSHNGHLWSTFVLPRVIYGLETLSLMKKDIENLEKFQRKSLRQIQGLPDKTPNCITLALLGVLPLETFIHKNTLNLFMSIAHNSKFIEYEIAMRQLAVKTPDEKSWFNMVRIILGTSNSLKVGQTHHVWSTVSNCLTDSKRTQLKCKLLTGTYILQGNRAAFNQYTVDPTCKLCLAAPATRQHFIAECSAYEPERVVYAEKLRNNPVLPDELKSDLLNTELFTQLTLDASFYINGCENLEALELHSREYILQIHRKSITRLNRQISES